MPPLCYAASRPAPVLQHTAVAGLVGARRSLQRRPQPRQLQAAISSAEVGRIMVVGEALWDAVPQGLFLGGAPLNVSVALHQLGAEVDFVTRVGADQLGGEILRRLASRGVGCGLIQEDPSHPTGFVKVTMRGSEPEYEIVSPSAWDHIRADDPGLRAAAAASAALVYGSLAQRGPRSRESIQELVALARRPVFDVNLREPFVDPRLVVACAKRSWLLKLNIAEAILMAGWMGLPSPAEPDAQPSPRAAALLAAALGPALGGSCHAVCVTGGEHGAGLWLLAGGGRGGKAGAAPACVSHPGCKVRAVDAIGAGDAFLASLLDSLLRDELRGTAEGSEEAAAAAAGAALARASSVAAFVVTRNGATPELDWEEIRALEREAGPATVWRW